MNVEIPANTSATIHIPGELDEIRINGKAAKESGISFKELEGEVVAEAGSGSYSIETSL